MTPSGISRRGVCWLVVTAGLVSMSSAAALDRKKEDVQRARSSFESAGTGYRQSLGRISILSALERDTLNDVKFVYDLSPVPSLTSSRQLGQRIIAISDGWFALVEQLTLANTATTASPGEGALASAKRQCFDLYGATVIHTARLNRQAMLKGTAGRRAVPDFEDFVASDENRECNEVTAVMLHSANAKETLQVGMNAALAWAIGRELALQIDPRDSKAYVDASDVGREFSCPAEMAESRSMDRAKALHINLVPGFAAVLLQESVFGVDGDDPRMCAQVEERLKTFFASLDGVDTSAGSAALSREIALRLYRLGSQSARVSRGK